MELKLQRVLHRVVLIASFNRTFMELKCKEVLKAAGSIRGFNRTFMELKLNSYYPYYIEDGF